MRAGKTHIAMVAVLHEIGAHMSAEGTVDKDSFKVVYVAPMNALAAEVTSALSKRLAPVVEASLSCLVHAIIRDCKCVKNLSQHCARAAFTRQQSWTDGWQ